MQATLRSRYHYKKRRADPLGRAYGRFLELTPAVVLSVLWLAGLAILGSCWRSTFTYRCWRGCEPIWPGSTPVMVGWHMDLPLDRVVTGLHADEIDDSCLEA